MYLFYFLEISISKLLNQSFYYAVNLNFVYLLLIFFFAIILLENILKAVGTTMRRVEEAAKV